ncbi:RnfH family protein [Undibacterium sp. SXout7W]|uniref:RnfH family protein n=1 Tax=Undibacterium sp. SXout7W TaxID=3413049 RepID=UPI003BEFA845
MAEMMSDYISVQVCYAGLESTSLLSLSVPAETNLGDVIERSGIIERHPEIDISVCKLGVFGKLKTLESSLHDGDRVEIYRPLIADPMEARRRRAKKQR